MRRFLETFLLVILSFYLTGQTVINVNVDNGQEDVESKFQHGVFYVPKTIEAQNDFLSNGIRQNSIRLNIIEGALNNTTNLSDCLLYLDGVSSILQEIAAKTDEVLFIFEKMPVWLSSSSDGSPASTPGWFVLNTKPPADYDAWDAMVEAVVDRIVNTYNIENASFEIWNEPDLGSWTGTKAEYFELFRHTYDAIKSVEAQIPVGGPATNHWGKNINYQQPYGYLSDEIADLSLVAELIDSTSKWNRPLDFVSWHSFDVVYQTTQNAVDYIDQKYNNLGLETPNLSVTEWNTPSVVRDEPLQRSYLIKNQMEMAKTGLSSNMIAAWQDFDQSSMEFHADYGLVTYGGIHKPAYNALKLSNKVRGELVLNTTDQSADIITSISNDTLIVLVVNYAPPAFVEAINHTLFEGQFDLNLLDELGYINVASNDFTRLDSIYNGQLIILNSNAVNIAINNSIPIYALYLALETSARDFTLNITGITGDYIGRNYTVDSCTNNFQFRYDSLLNNGFSQSEAILSITENQSLSSTIVNLENGTTSFSMQANSIQLFQYKIPELVNADQLPVELNIAIHPNPAGDFIEINCERTIGHFQIVDMTGKFVHSDESGDKNMKVEILSYPPGLYYISFFDLDRTLKFVRK